MNDLKEYQQILLEILKDCIDVCNSCDIPYFLIDGSCLGAIRHKGFIPWDDDVDIAILSSDYDRFYSAIKNKLDSHYEIELNFDQEKYPDHTDLMGRIYNRDYTVITDMFSTDNRNTTHPWIDIMLICGGPGNRFINRLFFYRIFMEKVILKLSNKNSIGFNSDKKRGIIEKFLLRIVELIDVSSLINESRQSKRLKRLLLKYAPSKSRYVFVFPSDYRIREMVPLDYFGCGRETKFEDIIVKVPLYAEKYLTSIYGDYMTLPPVEKRHTHVINVIS